MYSVLLGAIFAVAFAKEIYNLVTIKRHGKRVRSRIATKLLKMSRSSQIIRSLEVHSPGCTCCHGRHALQCPGATICPGH